MSDTQFAKVAVLGAGTMGAGIAQVCAQSGSQVVLQDITDEFVSKGLQRVSAFLQKGVDRGKVTEETRDQVLARIVTTTDRAEAAREADLVVEAVPEKLELKNGLFRELADVVSEACVLGSNTSSLSLAKVFDGVSNPGRCIGVHFFDPAPVVPSKRANGHADEHRNKGRCQPARSLHQPLRARRGPPRVGNDD